MISMLEMFIHGLFEFILRNCNIFGIDLFVDAQLGATLRRI